MPETLSKQWCNLPTTDGKFLNRLRAGLDLMVLGDCLCLFDGCNDETLQTLRDVFAEVKAGKSKLMLKEFVCCFDEKSCYAKVSS